MLVSLLLAPLLGCATGMKMSAKDIKNLKPGEGLVLGSVRIEGGKDILGRTNWALVAEEVREWPSFNLTDYTIEASRGGDEVVFLTKMPAGSYHFFRLVQPGFSTAKWAIWAPFEVQPGKTVYVGRLIIKFPPGLINVLTKIHIQVEDARQATVERAEREYGIALSDVVTDLMIVNYN